jgi:phytoene synthase
LPRAWLAERSIDPEDFLRSPTFSEDLGSVVARLLREADALYARAATGIARLPRECRWAIASASRVYAAIGDRVKDRGFDSLSARARVTTSQKILLVAKARWDAMILTPRCEYAPLSEARFLLDAVLA